MAPNTNSGNAIRHLNPFRDTVVSYREKAWRGTIPLPHKAKHPPPTGYTGHRAPYPTDGEITEWSNDGKRHNIGLRLAGVGNGYEIIGIDVDHYVSGDKDKKGGNQLSELEAKLGPLPETWISSAREDGISGIRYFRVPKGLAFRGQVEKDIECISKGYRFAVVWPSIHPDGGKYWWFPPGSVPDEQCRSVWDGVPPDARTLPALPEPWLTYLTQDKMRAEDADRIDMESTPREIQEWVVSTLHDAEADECCSLIRQKLEKHKKLIETEATSHDKIANAHMNLAHLAFEGHRGLVAAFDEIDSFWAQDVIKRDKRDLDELKAEIWRSKINALRKIKAKSDERVKIGAEPVDMRCDKSGQCGSETIPLGQADTDNPLSDIPGGFLSDVESYGTHDTGNAKHLVSMFSTADAPSMRWADGYGWIVWHEGKQPHWERDKTGIQEIRRMWQRVRMRQETYVEALEAQYENEQNKANAANGGAFQSPTSAGAPIALKAAYKKWQKWAKFVEDNGNRPRVDKAIDLAKSEVGIEIDVNLLDQNPLLLGVENGILELGLDDVVLRRATPGDYVTLNTHTPYQQAATHAQQIWENYLDTFLPDLEFRKVVQVILGHCLLGGNPEKTIIVLKGPTNSGKSTLIAAIESALGDYAGSVSHKFFQAKGFNEDLVEVMNKRFVSCSEFDGEDKLSASQLKRISSAVDKVTSPIKYSMERVSGDPQFVLCLATNEVPPITGVDKALWNRLKTIPFKHIPKHIDATASNQVKAVCGVPCFNWLIDGYLEYRRMGKLPTHPWIDEATDEFVSELDEVASFAFEMIHKHQHHDSPYPRWQDSPEWCVHTSEMYRRFELWWQESVGNERDKPGPNKFTRKMQSLGFNKKHVRIRDRSTAHWVGVKIVKSRTVVNAAERFNPADVAPVPVSGTERGTDD